MDEAIVEKVVKTNKGEIIENEDGVLCDLIQNGEIIKKFLPKETLIEVGLLEEDAMIVEEEDFCFLTEDSPKRTQKCEWTKDSTEYLLELYNNYLSSVGPMKKYKNKTAMWRKIAHEISACGVEVTSLQCENRFKTVRRRQCAKNKHKDSQDEDDLSSLEDFNFPAGYSSPDESVPTKESRRKRKRSLSCVLYKIHKEKERNRARRHREKMELLNRLLNKRT